MDVKQISSPLCSLGLGLHPQTQSLLTLLDLSIFVDVTVAKQHCSQLVQLRACDAGLGREGGWGREEMVWERTICTVKPVKICLHDVSLLVV